MQHLQYIKTFEQLAANQRTVVEEVVAELRAIQHFPVAEDVLSRWATRLRQVGVKTTDIDAAMYDPKKQRQYLVDGPSIAGRGSGALKELQKLITSAL